MNTDDILPSADSPAFEPAEPEWPEGGTLIRIPAGTVFHEPVDPKVVIMDKDGRVLHVVESEPIQIPPSRKVRVEGEAE